jgi:hypothetical protein
MQETTITLPWTNSDWHRRYQVEFDKAYQRVREQTWAAEAGGQSVNKIGSFWSLSGMRAYTAGCQP